MTGLLQLNPPLPVVTPHGNGYAHFMIDYGQEHHILWVVAQDSTGEFWTWENPKIRMQNNLTMNRPKTPETAKTWVSAEGGGGWGNETKSSGGSFSPNWKTTTVSLSELYSKGKR